PIAELDFATIGLPEDFTAYLHSFAWLRDLSAAATRERGAKIAEGIARKWLAAFAEQISEPAWRADLWGRRVLFWTAYAPYILSSSDLVYRSSLLYTLARGARHLERSADKGPPGLARIAAWSGVIAAALVVQGGPGRLKTGEAGLARAIGAAFHDDGGLVSRSPTEQLAAVEILSQLRAAYAAARRDTPEWLTEALVAAVGALLSVTLGDEALSSWQSGHMASRRRVIAAAEGAGMDAAPLRQARGWGYQRVQARTTVLVLDAAPPPPFGADPLRGEIPSRAGDRGYLHRRRPGRAAEAEGRRLAVPLPRRPAPGRGQLVDRRRGAPARDPPAGDHRGIAGRRHDHLLGAQAGLLKRTG